MKDSETRQRENQHIEELVRLAQAGDQQALNQVVVLFNTPLRSMVARRIYDHDQVEDLVQNILVRVYRFLPRFRFQSNFRTWVYRVAENEIRNHYRAQKAKTEKLSVDLADAKQGFEQQVENSVDVQRVLRKLKPAYAQILTLYYIEGQRLSEISQLLHLKSSATKMRMNRARQAFARQYSYSV